MKNPLLKRTMPPAIVDSRHVPTITEGPARTDPNTDITSYKERKCLREYIGLRSAGGAPIPPLGGWPAEPEPACLRSAGGVPIKPLSEKTVQARETEATNEPIRTPQKKGLIARIIDKLFGRN